MPRPEKVQAVAEIKEQFEAAEAVFVTEYRGIAVQQMGDLRRKLREAGTDYKVVKMTLARRAASDLGIEGVDEYLIGPTGLAFAKDDPVAAAKVLNDYAKDNERLVIKLGLLANKLLRPEEVAKLAEIEPREVLLAKFAGAARAPLAAFAGMLASFTRDAAGLFSALVDKKEAEGPAPAASGSDEDADSADSEDSADSADTPDDPTDSADSDNPEDSDESADDPAEEE